MASVRASRPGNDERHRLLVSLTCFIVRFSGGPELAGQIRVSTILPVFTDTAFTEHVKSPELKAQMQKAGETFAMSPAAVANALVYILQQPDEVNIGEVTLRSRAQA